MTTFNLFSKIIFLAASLNLVVSFCGRAANSQSQLSQTSSDIVNLKIITTTDIHASVFHQGFPSAGQPEGGLASVHGYVQGLRQRYPDQVILLDNGDLIQGHPAGYYFNFVEKADSNAFARILNFMGYDAAVVGNHDIEAGPDVYNQLKKDFRFPYLGANVLDESTGKPAFVPYTIIERNGLRVAVLGITTPTIPQWLPRKLWDGLAFEGMAEAASKWITVIKETETPDAIIGLFHSGGGDENTYDGANTENASYYVAKNVDGFDVIFTGHDHRARTTIVNNQWGEDVLVIGTNSHGRSVAEVDLVFEKLSGENYNLSNVRGKITDVSNKEPDGHFMSAFALEKKDIEAFLNQRVAHLDSTINSRSAYLGNSAFVDFIHELQLTIANAEISFAAPLSFNVTLVEGEFLMSHLFNLYPFENYLYVMELSGNEILQYLEFSYGLWFETWLEQANHVLAFRRDEHGDVILNEKGKARLANPFYNFDSAAGIRYTVDLSKPVGDRIAIESMEDGNDFEPEKIYRVAINSYRGSGGGGHLVQGAEIPADMLETRIVWVSESDLRSHIAKLLNGETWQPQPNDNWKLLPESKELIESLKRDLDILF